MKLKISLGSGIEFDSDTKKVQGDTDACKQFYRTFTTIADMSMKNICDEMGQKGWLWSEVSVESESSSPEVESSEEPEAPKEEEKPKKKSRWSSKSKDEEA